MPSSAGRRERQRYDAPAERRLQPPLRVIATREGVPLPFVGREIRHWQERLNIPNTLADEQFAESADLGEVVAAARREDTKADADWG